MDHRLRILSFLLGNPAENAQFRDCRDRTAKGKMKRYCKECGGVLAGRRDKIFCGEHCRSAFHNRQSRPQDTFIRQTNRILARNRAILAAAWSAPCIRYRELVRSGFRFDLWTSQRRTRWGMQVRYCYDLGYHIGWLGRVTLYRSPQIPVPGETGSGNESSSSLPPSSTAYSAP